MAWPGVQTAGVVVSGGDGADFGFHHQSGGVHHVAHQYLAKYERKARRENRLDKKIIYPYLIISDEGAVYGVAWREMPLSSSAVCCSF